MSSDFQGFEGVTFGRLRGKRFAIAREDGDSVGIDLGWFQVSDHKVQIHA